MTTGMLLGKFMPPHLGHVYLGEFARNYVDELTIVVGTLDREPIPGELRYRWMCELFPDVRVIHLTDELPQYPEEHPDFWHIWQTTLQGILPGRPDYVFASEDYGQKLAEVLGATFVPVNKSRDIVPVSGTAIREDPSQHWDYLPRCVRPYFVKRVCIFGPESTGKTTLAQQLAKEYKTIFVPEYARTLIEAQAGEIAIEDMRRIAKGQAASEDALARNATRLLFCDTDVLATTIWSETLFGECDPWIQAEAERRDYDLYLLLDVDVPWVADVARYLSEERQAFFARCRVELDARQRPYVVVQGDWPERWARACEAVDSLFRDPR